MLLIKALNRLGTLFNLQIYPDQDHSLPEVSKHLYATLNSFVTECFELESYYDDVVGLRRKRFRPSNWLRSSLVSLATSSHYLSSSLLSLHIHNQWYAFNFCISINFGIVVMYIICIFMFPITSTLFSLSYHHHQLHHLHLVYLFILICQISNSFIWLIM